MKEVIETVEMTASANLQIRRYSKGMVQRIGLAQAIVHRPKLLILDEPTSGLDPIGRRQMRDIILAERARGTTVLFCTHIIPDVEAVCDRVAVLVSGQLVREGRVQELLATQVPLVELTVENLALSALTQMGVELAHATEISDRVLVRLSDAACQVLLPKVLSAGGRIAQLQRARFSLEDLFLQTMDQAKGRTVGGEIA